jgi:hypothetical protein
MYEVGIRMVAPRADVREVDAVVVARTDRSRAQVRDRPAEVWVTPFDEIFRGPESDADRTTEEREPAIPILELGRTVVEVNVSVAEEDRHLAAPAAEEQYIRPPAVAEGFNVTFDDAFRGAELRPKVAAAPTPVDEREEREPEPETETVAEVVEEPEPEPVPEVVAEVLEEPEPEPVVQEVEAEPVFDTSTCNIAVWRGYRKAMFYAQSLDGDETVALAESPTFKYSGNGTPDQTEAAAQAYQALVELLREEGWRTVDEGPAWFEQTLTRS